MALTDRQEFFSITIKADGVIEVQLDRVIMDGIEEIARQTRGLFYTPDMALADVPAKIKQAVNMSVVWSQAVIDAYRLAHPGTVIQP
jgi:hypothetical protein